MSPRERAEVILTMNPHVSADWAALTPVAKDVVCFNEASLRAWLESTLRARMS